MTAALMQFVIDHWRWAVPPAAGGTFLIIQKQLRLWFHATKIDNSSDAVRALEIETRSRWRRRRPPGGDP